MTILRCLAMSVVIIVLYAGSANGMERAFIRIGQTSREPRIDGTLNAGEWDQAPLIRNFIKAHGGELAKNDTEFSICYNERYLYIMVKAHSFALNPASNQTDEFKANIRDRDGNVWNDDCIELRLEKVHPSVTDAFYIAFNAVGAVLDMRHTQDGWQRNWNADITVAATVQKGFWVCEIAIPLEDLGSSDNCPGDRWRFNLVRFDQCGNQPSSWSNLADGNHMNLDNLGVIEMGRGDSAVVEVLPSSQDKMSSRQAEVNVRNARLASWQSVVTAGSGHLTKLDGKVTSTESGKPLVIQWHDGSGAGQKHIQFSVFDEPRKLLYRSPMIPFLGDGQKLEVRMEGPVETELFVNEKKCRRDADGKFDTELELLPGANVVAVKTKTAADLNCSLRVSGMELPGKSVWKYANNPQGEWWKWDYDDSGWKHGRIGEIKTSASDWIILRRVIMRNATRLLPEFPQGVWHLTQDGTYMLAWTGSGLSRWPIRHALDDFELVLDVPAELEFLGASWYKFPMTGPKRKDGTINPTDKLYSTRKAGSVRHGNIDYTRFIVSANFPVTLVAGKEIWLDKVRRKDKTCSLAFRARRQTGNGAFAMLQYRCRAFNGSYTELPNAIYCSVSPPLDGKAPEKLSIMLKVHSSGLKNDAILKGYYQTLKDGGINEFFGPCYSEYPQSIGLKPHYYFSMFDSTYYTFSDSMAAMDELFDEYPEARGRWNDQLRFGVDPSFVTRNRETWPLIKKAIAQISARKPGLTDLFWDYEFSPFPGHLQAYPCFSKCGIDAFAKQYQIQEKLTPNIIRKRYKDKWIDFTCDEVANMIKLVHRFVNEYGMNLSVYSGYQNCKNGKEYYNIDWSLIGNNVDKVYCGYGDNQNLIAATRKAVKGRPVAGGLLRQGKTVSWHSPGAILKKIVDCGGGVLCWYESRFDARILQSIAEASRAVARFERFLLKGKRSDDLIIVKADKGFGKAVYELDNEILVLVFSDRKSIDGEFEFSCRKPVDIFVEFYTEHAFDGTGPVRIQVPGGAIRAFVGKIKRETD